MSRFGCEVNPHYFNRACGYFTQNRSRYLKDTGSLPPKRKPRVFEMFLGGELAPNDEPVLRFGAIHVQPHLNITQLGDSGFIISGPYFSVVAEVADYLNYSIRPTHLVDEDVVDASLKDRLDFAVSNVAPVFSFTLDIFDGIIIDKMFGFSMSVLGLKKVGSVTKTLGVLEMDAIIQAPTQDKSRNNFRFLTAFEPITWGAIALGGVAVAVALASKYRGKLAKMLEFVVYSTFGSPELSFVKQIPNLLLLWAMAMWLLHQFFDGDMLSVLMEPAQLDVIDTLEELSRSDKLINIMTTEVMGKRDNLMILESYFKGYGDIRHELMELSVVNDALHTWGNEEKLEPYIKSNVERNPELFAVLVWKSVADYLKNRLGNRRFQEVLYVSEAAGDIQPVFFITSFFASDQKIKAMDFVIQQLMEGGIFPRWAKWATYDWHDVEEAKPLLEFKVALGDVFIGPFLFCSVFHVISVVMLVVEKVVFLGVTFLSMTVIQKVLHNIS